MKRALVVVQWGAFVGALLGSVLFYALWISDDIHVISDYGFGSGPSPHAGYGGLVELLFVGLPAASCLALGWAVTFFLRAGYRVAVPRRTLWATAAIGASGLALLAFEAVVDHLNDRERGKELAANAVSSPLRSDASLRGTETIEEAFAAGDADRVRDLAASHLDVAGALVHLVDPSKLALYPGEVGWESLRAKWASSPPARTMASAIRSYAIGAPEGFPASEKDVLDVLTSTLASMELCIDPTVGPAPLEPWMKDTRLCTCNYCPYVRQINWAILAALYPSEIPALDRSKHVAMLRTLARSAVQSGADQEPILRMAVYDRNLYLLELLEGEGFDVRAADGDFAADRFLDLSDYQMMKAHLAAKGIRWRGDDAGD